MVLGLCPIFPVWFPIDGALDPIKIIPMIKHHLQCGPWAVVDGFTDALWINVEKKALANLIARAFSWKTNAVVVDISKAANYESNLIDSTVVLDWSLSPIARESHGLPMISSADLELQDYTAHDRVLLNSTGPLPLDRPQREEILTQILGFITVTQSVWTDLDQAVDPASQQPTHLLQQIMDCYSIELTVSDIEDRLCHTANTLMSQYTLPCVQILNWLDRLYD